MFGKINNCSTNTSVTGAGERVGGLVGHSESDINKSELTKAIEKSFPNEEYNLEEEINLKKIQMQIFKINNHIHRILHNAEEP